MMRTVLALAVGMAILPGLTGCGESDPDDDKMNERREPPAEKRAAPGSGLGLSSEGGEEGEAEEEATGGGD